VDAAVARRDADLTAGNALDLVAGQPVVGAAGLAAEMGRVEE